MILAAHRGDDRAVIGDVGALDFSLMDLGKERVLEVFQQGGPSAETIIENMLWSLRKFTGLAKPVDDITMIVAKVN